MYFVKKDNTNELLIEDNIVVTNKKVYTFMTEDAYKNAMTFDTHILSIVKSRYKVILKHKIEKMNLKRKDFSIVKG